MNAAEDSSSEPQKHLHDVPGHIHSMYVSAQSKHSPRRLIPSNSALILREAIKEQQFTLRSHLLSSNLVQWQQSDQSHLAARSYIDFRIHTLQLNQKEFGYFSLVHPRA